jgi:hypothetical protein
MGVLPVIANQGFCPNDTRLVRVSKEARLVAKAGTNRGRGRSEALWRSPARMLLSAPTKRLGDITIDERK